MFKSLLIGGTILIALHDMSYAQQKNTPASPLGVDLKMTLYQDSFAFVRDHYKVDLAKGLNTITLNAVNPEIQSDSLFINAGNAILVDQTFDFNVLTPQSLLAQNVGQIIKFQRVHPISGSEEIIKGKLLSATEPYIVDVNGKIHIGAPGKPILENQKDITPLPHLTLTLESKNVKKQQDLILNYLSYGLNWSTSYSALYNQEDQTIRLSPWANLTNTTTRSYKNIEIELAFARLNLENHAPQPRFSLAQPLAKTAVLAEAANDNPPTPQASGDLYLYKLASRIDLKAGETKKVTLHEQEDFKTTRKLVHSFPATWGQQNSEGQVIHPRIELAFKNATDHPLAQGIVRFYQTDKNADTQFIGEDQMSHHSQGDEIKLYPGQSFDVSLKQTQTAYEVLDKTRYKATYEVLIENKGQKTETVRFSDNFPNNWVLIESSVRPSQTVGNQMTYEVMVKPAQKTTIGYSVEINTRP